LEKDKCKKSKKKGVKKIGVKKGTPLKITRGCSKITYKINIKNDKNSNLS